jgi:RNA polymerase sigma-70 factor, ECF subfamily
VNAEEFEDFYAAAFPRLVGQLQVLTGSHAEAQDAVQEAFVRAWERRSKIDADGAPEAWVRATAWRIAVSRWRRAKRFGWLLRIMDGPQVAAGPEPDRVAFADGLARLPTEHRRALILFYVCDLSVDQVAAETGAPAGTVKARLARGRASLASYLADDITSPLTESDVVVRDA